MPCPSSGDDLSNSTARAASLPAIIAAAMGSESILKKSLTSFGQSVCSEPLAGDESAITDKLEERRHASRHPYDLRLGTYVALLS